MNAIRKAIEILLTIGIAISLLFAFVNTNAFNVALSRWQMPVSPSEKAFLDQLECVDEFIAGIPPKSRVKLVAQVIEWDERVVEIGYPRIIFTNSDEDLQLAVSSIRQDFAPVKCGERLFLGINENLSCDADLFCTLES
jgi:hypothetical protein